MIRKFAAAALSILLLTGCAAEKPQEEPPMTEPTAAVTEPRLSVYDAMVERSLLNIGNPYRLQQKIRAAQNGEDITIAYIGGSITEGLDVGYTERYVTLSAREFEEAYCSSGTVTCVNAGLSGTPSNLGLVRLQKDVLDHEPDIVFVEFAVNDSQDFHEKQCFESLIRTVLTQENEPAVVLIFNRTQDGYTCQSVMGLTGMFYRLPMVSVTNAITEELDAGRMTWRDYSNDTVHPNAQGHRMTADFLAHLFAEAEAGEWEPYSVPEDKQYQAPFVSPVLITPDTETELISDIGSFEVFRGNRTGFAVQWRNTGTEPMKFTVTGNAVFLIYHRGNRGNLGSADVYINGEKAMTLDAKDPDGWGEPYSKLLVKSKTVETYDIEIHPHGSSEEGIFDIYGIAYTQNEK